MYLFWESPCRYLTFIWNFEMLIKCNANVSIPGAMENANVMQMKCNAKKCKILGEIQYHEYVIGIILNIYRFICSYLFPQPFSTNQIRHL